MGNDDKVTDLVTQTKLEFLREVIEDFKRRQSRYDLGREFAKTKKNRSPLVPILVIGMIVLFAAGAIGVTAYINQTQGNIEVNIGDFEDVNLRDLLDQARQLEQELEDARRRLAALEAERDNRILTVQNSAEREVNLLRARNLAQAELQSQAAEIRANADEQIAAVRAEYEDRIAAVEAEIEEIQGRIAEYDARQLEQAREQERILDNQVRLHEIELETQARGYEERIEILTADYEARIAELETFANNLEDNLRAAHADELAALRAQHAQEIANLIALYNPTFTSAEILALVNAPADPATIGGLDLVAFDSALAAEGVLTRAGYDSLSRRLGEYLRLIDRLREVPYENSIPGTLDQLEFRMVELIRRYESLWGGLLQTVAGRDEVISARNARIADLEDELATAISVRDGVIAERQAEIDRFLYALEALAEQNRENGYILDARDTANIVVFLDTIREVEDGTIGYVFRRDDEFIGTIRFTTTARGMAASLVELAGDTSLAPYDKVLVEVQ